MSESGVVTSVTGKMFMLSSVLNVLVEVDGGCCVCVRSAINHLVEELPDYKDFIMMDLKVNHKDVYEDLFEDDDD